MRVLTCIDPRERVDCWLCVFIRFFFSISVLMVLYYLPEFEKLIKGEEVVFEPKLNKSLIVILIFFHALISSLYSAIKHFTKENKKKKETEEQA